MRIALGADHNGYDLKEALKQALLDLGHEVLDLGTNSKDSVDYPDYAEAVGGAVAGGEADRGVLVCGTGLGMAIAANKVPGVRAVPVTDQYSAKMARRDNDANVITFGGHMTAAPLALDLLKTFLETPFEGGRHARRIGKIQTLESAREKGPPAPR